MDDVVQEFLSYMDTVKGRSKQTITSYKDDLSLFCDFVKRHKNITKIDKATLSQIQLTDLYAFLSYLSKERHNKPASRARRVACLKAFFNYLTRMKIIKENPTLDLEPPKLEKRLPTYLTLEESKELLSVVGGKQKERDYLILTLLLNCGLRLSELVNINTKDIQGDTLKVIGKGNKERTIYLNPACLKALERYLEVRKPKNSKALIPTDRQPRISKKTIQYIVKKYLRKADLDEDKFSVHKLRHTAATLMYQNGVDIRSLQEILGHESVSTTEIYTHIDNRQLKAAVNANPLADL